MEDMFFFLAFVSCWITNNNTYYTYMLCCMFREIFGIDFVCIANVRFLHNECSQINLVFAEKIPTRIDKEWIASVRIHLIELVFVCMQRKTHNWRPLKEFECDKIVCWAVDLIIFLIYTVCLQNLQSCVVIKKIWAISLCSAPFE